MSASNKDNAKNVVYPHSQAKLDLYKSYLLFYLKVLGLAPFCTKINLFDIYCGIGVYKDGNIGSPLITNQCVKEINNIIEQLGKHIKPITIIINDNQKDKIKNVKSILETQKNVNCTYDYYNKDADEMLEIVSQKVNAYKATERSLIFIDPYGYSDIHRDKIFQLIKNEHTEIILFLPVMQMYRFKDIAINDPEKSCYENLRKFIFSFFPATHKIRTDKIQNVFEFINEIKVALSFNNKFYTCSHYIEREKGNYYALFFITANIYGLDKMVESKWKLDPVKGKGFTQKKTSNQGSFFDEEFQEHDNLMHVDNLKSLLLAELKLKKILNNNDVYKIALLNEFRATHAKIVLDDLLKNKRIDTCDLEGSHVASSGAYYLDYTHYKNKENKVYFKKI